MTKRTFAFRTPVMGAATAGLLLFSCGALAETGAVQGSPVAFSVSFGTLGVGAEASVPINPWLQLRAQVNGLSVNHHVDSSGNRFHGSLRFLTYGALVDVYPFAGRFRVSAGVYGDGNRVGLKGRCDQGCDIGDYTITTNPSQSGHFWGRLKFNAVAPYAGIGWGNAMIGSRLHFAFNLGALYQGSPKVSLRADGTATIDRNDGTPPVTEDVGSDPAAQAEVAKQQRKTANDISSFRFWPVISFAIGWRFGG